MKKKKRKRKRKKKRKRKRKRRKSLIRRRRNKHQHLHLHLHKNQNLRMPDPLESLENPESLEIQRKLESPENPESLEIQTSPESPEEIVDPNMMIGTAKDIHQMIVKVDNPGKIGTIGNLVLTTTGNPVLTTTGSLVLTTTGSLVLAVGLIGMITTKGEDHHHIIKRSQRGEQSHALLHQRKRRNPSRPKRKHLVPLLKRKYSLKRNLQTLLTFLKWRMNEHKKKMINFISHLLLWCLEEEKSKTKNTHIHTHNTQRHPPFFLYYSFLPFLHHHYLFHYFNPNRYNQKQINK